MGFKGCHGLKVGECENKSTANGYDFIFRVRDISFGARVSAGSYLNKKIKGTLLTFAHIIRQKISLKGQEQGMTLKGILRLDEDSAFIFKIMEMVSGCRRGFKLVEPYIVTKSVRNPSVGSS